MARQIILLEKSLSPGGINQRFAFWLTPTVVGGVRNPHATSAFVGANAAEVTAIQTGQVVEQVDSVQYPANATVAQIEADLQTRYATAQSVLSSAPKQNEWYGTSFDGTTWTAASLQPTLPVTGKNGSVNFALAAGDNTILPAVPGQAWLIDRAHLSFDTSGLVIFKDGPNTEIGRAFVNANKDLIFTKEDTPWIKTSPGNALVVNASAVINAAGQMWFRQA